LNLLPAEKVERIRKSKNLAFHQSIWRGKRGETLDEKLGLLKYHPHLRKVQPQIVQLAP